MRGAGGTAPCSCGKIAKRIGPFADPPPHGCMGVSGGRAPDPSFLDALFLPRRSKHHRLRRPLCPARCAPPVLTDSPRIQQLRLSFSSSPVALLPVASEPPLPPVSISSPSSPSASAVAAARGQTISLQFLASRGANLNCFDSFGLAPLYEAVRSRPSLHPPLLRAPTPPPSQQESEEAESSLCVGPCPLSNAEIKSPLSRFFAS